MSDMIPGRRVSGRPGMGVRYGWRAWVRADQSGRVNWPTDRLQPLGWSGLTQPLCVGRNRLCMATRSAIIGRQRLASTGSRLRHQLEPRSLSRRPLSATLCQLRLGRAWHLRPAPMCPLEPAHSLTLESGLKARICGGYAWRWLCPVTGRVGRWLRVGKGKIALTSRRWTDNCRLDLQAQQEDRQTQAGQVSLFSWHLVYLDHIQLIILLVLLPLASSSTSWFSSSLPPPPPLLLVHLVGPKATTSFKTSLLRRRPQALLAFSAAGSSPSKSCFVAYNSSWAARVANSHLLAHSCLANY